ncbi:MAG: hypothetical protein ABJE10_14290 [bacterium]
MTSTRGGTMTQSTHEQPQCSRVRPVPAPGTVTSPNTVLILAQRVMRTNSRLAIIAFTLASASCAGHSTTPTLDPVSELTDGFDASVRRDVETLRRTMSSYNDLSVVEAAGYPTKLTKCVADSTMGGMGYHFVDSKVWDDKLELEHPEMLVYAPVEGGKVELVAVEYAVPYRARAATETAPRLFGQEFRKAGTYWELHVWAWRKNRAGLFADWNPAVKC